MMIMNARVSLTKKIIFKKSYVYGSMGQLMVSYNIYKNVLYRCFFIHDNMETRILYEYVKAANPEISEIQIIEYDSTLYSSGETRIIIQLRLIYARIHQTRQKYIHLLVKH